MAKVLIVDDSAFTRNLLGRLLQGAGHEIVGTAANGTEALSLYGQLQPDLVTLDYLMPDMNGEAVLGEILEQDPTARVIMISGSGDHSIEERALAKGASLFIDKPDVQRRIVGAIDQILHV
jgi:two-component system chemotaxis response regulator CheY